MKLCTRLGEDFDILYVQIGATDAEIWQVKVCTKIRVRRTKINRQISDLRSGSAGADPEVRRHLAGEHFGEV